MDPFQDRSWDYDVLSDIYCDNQLCAGTEFDASLSGPVSQEHMVTRKCADTEFDAQVSDRVSPQNISARKRGRNESCSGPGSKACREKLRRDKINDMFSTLCSILEPGRPAKTDKSSILSDAIHVLNQLRTEAQELKQTNEKLQEDIKVLKAEKNELREEKIQLKADKERMEQQVKSMTVQPIGFIPPQLAAYSAPVNKMMAFPAYSGFPPMWQMMHPADHDTSQDHTRLPPSA